MYLIAFYVSLNTCLEWTLKDKDNTVMLPQSATETEASWLEFKAITWLNARFPVRPGRSPTPQLR
jgi:hypothetical protein